MTEKTTGDDGFTAEEEAMFAPPTDDPLTADAGEEAKANDAADAEKPANEGAENDAEGQAAGDDGEKSSGDPGFVPVAVLREERREKAELRQQLQQVQERGEERLNKILERIAPKAQADENAPDEPLEPFDQTKHDVFDYVTRLSAENAKLRDWRQSQDQERAQAQAIQEEERFLQETGAVVNQMTQEFAKTNPDYPERITGFIREQALGLSKLYRKPAEKIAADISRDLMIQANHMIRSGENPIEYFDAMTRDFAVSPAPADPTAGLEKAEDETAKPSPEEAFTSLATTSGSSGTRRKGMADIAAMSDEDFEAYLDGGDFQKDFGPAA